MSQHRIGIIGGSGLYHIDGFTHQKWVKVKTPFGPPSDSFLTGKLAGREVVFLPRHGRGHRILPSELNHRANIWGMKKLGVAWIISVSAVGSLQAKYRPCDIVLPDQFLDRTKQSAAHTFFGRGIVGHIAFAHPICEELRQLLLKTARALKARVHDGGTYVNMEGPAFSTRAESLTNRKLGYDVIGMTNLGEAKCCARGRDRLRHDGDDHRLRLLEGGRGARHGGNGDRQPESERRHGQGDHHQGAAADSRRAELAVSRRVAERHHDRPEALAGQDHAGASTDPAEVPVTEAGLNTAASRAPGWHGASPAPAGCRR